MLSYEALSAALYELYPAFREAALSRRRFRQEDILPLIEARRKAGIFAVEKVGVSFEGRPIQMLRAGRGETRVLLWSQMHGNEPTATMACFDIFRLFEGRDDGLDVFREKILAGITLYFVPMLNPDGAERYQRETAQGIDMNRDALALQTPEGRLLKRLVEELKPHFGFNLHDQNPRYSAGQSNKLATISFLATAYDYALSLNEVRKRSMQLIVRMNRVLQRYIPGHVARFCDDYEPRAFGDNIQKWGTTLVLIESGGYAGDPEKQYIRQLNFVAILTGLDAVADNTLTAEPHQAYFDLPVNGNQIYDLVIRNLTIRQGGTAFKADLGINRSEVNLQGERDFFYHGTVEGFGDLHTQSGTREMDGEGLSLESGAVYPEIFASIKDMRGLDAWKLLKAGYTYVRLTPYAGAEKEEYTRHPVHVLAGSCQPGDVIPGKGQTATFLLKKDGRLRYALVNGFLYDLQREPEPEGNGIVSY